MARTTIKATYSLAPDVVGQLERLAKSWKVSKSEALTRAIVNAAQINPPDDEIAAALATLHELQHVAQISESDANAWKHSVRDERHRSDRLER